MTLQKAFGDKPVRVSLTTGKIMLKNKKKNSTEAVAFSDKAVSVSLTMGTIMSRYEKRNSTESVAQRSSVKKVFFEIWQN